MDRRTAVVVDDGELADVRALLGELGAEFAHWGGGGPPGGREPVATQLFVITARLAVALGVQRSGSPGADRPTWVVVSETESRTQRTLLQRKGFHSVVARPVHPAVLRAVVRRALYEGERTQRRPRVAAGCIASYRIGLRRSRATVVDLSRSGCRLLGSSPLDPGTRLTLQLEGKTLGLGTLRLPGFVVRATPATADGGTPLDVSLGVRFDPLPDRTGGRLRAAIQALATGPLPRDGAPCTRPILAPALARLRRHPDRSGPPPTTHRRQPRGIYERKVFALGLPNGAVVALDLSPGGMRVERHPALALGTRLRLAVEGEQRTEPVLVDAVVARDDGDHGLALQFEPLAPMCEYRLGAIVAGLPPILPA